MPCSTSFSTSWCRAGFRASAQRLGLLETVRDHEVEILGHALEETADLLVHLPSRRAWGVVVEALSDVRWRELPTVKIDCHGSPYANGSSSGSTAGSRWRRRIDTGLSAPIARIHVATATP